MTELQDIINTLMQQNQSNASKITTIIEKHLGKGKKVSDCTEDQVAQVDLIIFDLKKL